MAENFRKMERRSSLRSNIFLFESTAVLFGYLYILFPWSTSDSFQLTSQKTLMAIFGAVYMIRLNVMARWLLQRELAMEELTVVILVWLPSIMASFAYNVNESIGSKALIMSTILYLFGSYLNTFSELQRKRWKEIPANKGRCYTQGLFSASRNINYFGDTMLFAGWALSTGVVWNGWAPLVMGLSFWFFHIPDKEKYLKKRYEKDWPSYVAQTPYAFVPYVC